MGMEPSTGGKSRIEIDESKVITNDNITRWMFGLVDRGNYDIRIFFVNDNRTRKTLLPIIKNNVYSYYNEIYNNRDPAPNNHNLDYVFPTRIYSDSFSSYQEVDFNSLGFKLYRINHSVWFGQGSFHTNTVEGVWSKLKRLADNFNGLTGKVIEYYEKKGINRFDYVNGWICKSLFFMKCEHLKLGDNAKRELLAKYLKYSEN